MQCKPRRPHCKQNIGPAARVPGNRWTSRNSGVDAQVVNVPISEDMTCRVRATRDRLTAVKSPAVHTIANPNRTVIVSIIWRRNALPEMRDLNRDQQKSVWRKAYLRAFREPFAWIGILNFFVIAMIGRSLAGEFGMLIGAVIGAIVMMQFHLRAARPYMVQAREEMGLGAVSVNRHRCEARCTLLSGCTSYGGRR